MKQGGKTKKDALRSNVKTDKSMDSCAYTSPLSNLDLRGVHKSNGLHDFNCPEECAGPGAAPLYLLQSVCTAVFYDHIATYTLLLTNFPGEVYVRNHLMWISSTYVMLQYYLCLIFLVYYVSLYLGAEIDISITQFSHA